MDRNSVLAFILIAVVLILTPYYMNIVAPPPAPQAADSTAVVPDTLLPGAKPSTANVPMTTTASPDSGEYPVGDSAAVTVDTPLYTAIISSRNGGSLQSYQLHQYTMFDTLPVQLIIPRNRNNLLLQSLSIDGEYLVLDHHWTLVDEDSALEVDTGTRELHFRTSVLGKPVTKTLRFHADSYVIDVEVDFTAPASLLSENTFSISWKGGMPVTEKNPKDDLFYFRGYVYQAGEVHDPKIPRKGELNDQLTGKTNWVAVRSKYFGAALLPEQAGVGARIEGAKTEDGTPVYSVTLVASAESPQKIALYLGPLEYKRIHAIDEGLDQIMTMGWSIIRPISRGILALLTWSHKWIPNYGVILILFAIAVKIIVYPLTKKSYQSTKKMQQIQPMLVKLKEKYKNDPQKLNKATMNLYKEYGVNPLGGCLPLLLQMPLLIALFQVFRSTIELRGAPFVLWIKDLSAPDTLLHIGSFPLNILPIIMAATMLLQQMMMPTTQAPGQQKQMTYIMNFVMLFIFYRFPSGLNLYYTLFNVLTIVQQKYLTPAEPAPVPVNSRGKSTRKK